MRDKSHIYPDVIPETGIGTPSLGDRSQRILMVKDKASACFHHDRIRTIDNIVTGPVESYRREVLLPCGYDIAVLRVREDRLPSITVIDRHRIRRRLLPRPEQPVLIHRHGCLHTVSLYPPEHISGILLVPFKRHCTVSEPYRLLPVRQHTQDRQQGCHAGFPY